MTRFRLLALVTGLNFIACGGGGGEEKKAFDTLFPEDNAIGAWVIDDVHGSGSNSVTNPDGLEIAANDDELDDLINGGKKPFTDRDFVNFGREYYKSGDYEAKLWIVEMPSTEVATDLYDDLVTDTLYEYLNETITAGTADAARAGDDGLFWDFHARKGAFFVLVENLRNDADGRTKGEEFLTGVAAGL